MPGPTGRGMQPTKPLSTRSTRAPNSRANGSSESARGDDPCIAVKAPPSVEESRVSVDMPVQGPRSQVDAWRAAIVQDGPFFGQVLSRWQPVAERPLTL